METVPSTRLSTDLEISRRWLPLCGQLDLEIVYSPTSTFSCQETTPHVILLEPLLICLLAIADKYEQGVTPKAVQMRFERLKKEPDWLGNDANGDSSSAAPKAKNPRTPKKKAAKKTVKEDDGDDEEDDDEAEISPSKFTPDAFNKTKGGRVTKARTPRKAAFKAPKYVQGDTEKEEEDDDNMYDGENAGTVVVKNESNDYGASFSNGNGHANGHANGSGYADDEDQDEEEVYHHASSNQYGNGYDEDAV